LTADINGGRWNKAPVRVSRARWKSEGSARAECRRITQTYSLPGGGRSNEVVDRGRASIHGRVLMVMFF